MKLCLQVNVICCTKYLVIVVTKTIIIIFYHIQHLMPVPIAINVPKVPPPWSIIFPTLFTNSLPRSPYLMKQRGNIRFQNTQSYKPSNQYKLSSTWVLRNLQKEHQMPCQHRSLLWIPSSCDPSSLAQTGTIQQEQALYRICYKTKVYIYIYMMMIYCSVYLSPNLLCYLYGPKQYTNNHLRIYISD